MRVCSRCIHGAGRPDDRIARLVFSTFLDQLNAAWICLAAGTIHPSSSAVRNGIQSHAMYIATHFAHMNPTQVNRAHISHRQFGHAPHAKRVENCRRCSRGSRVGGATAPVCIAHARHFGQLGLWWLVMCENVPQPTLHCIAVA